MDADVVRIVDANLNRAREALRVIEDHTRFALREPSATAVAKQMRHDLRAFAAWIADDARLLYRDVQGDVGREQTTAGELTRVAAADVVHAAFGRLTEASRSLAEYGKLIDPRFAAHAERLRFQAYQLEQRLTLRSPLASRFRSHPLYVLVTESRCRGDWLAAVRSLVAGAAPLILQLREKSLPDVELLRRARILRELVSERGGMFVVNDRPDIARLARADGVHVGQDDLSVRDAREIAGAQMLIGKSTHTIEQVESALAEEPDYLAVGPMYPSETKPQDHVPGPALLAQAAQRTTLPLVAIGGIGPHQAADLYRAGAGSLAVCSAVWDAPAPPAAARRFLDAAAAPPTNPVAVR